jgi:hypothetical protein
MFTEAFLWSGPHLARGQGAETCRSQKVSDVSPIKAMYERLWHRRKFTVPNLECSLPFWFPTKDSYA